jgi:ADP-ribosylglycohydrolase
MAARSGLPARPPHAPTSHDPVHHHHPSIVAGAAAGGSKPSKLMDFQQKIKAEQEAKNMEKLKKEEQRLARVKEEEERRRVEKLQQKKALQVSS